MSDFRHRRGSSYEDRPNEYDRTRRGSSYGEVYPSDHDALPRDGGPSRGSAKQAEDDLYDYLLEFNMSHNFDVLLEHGLSSINALLHASSDDLERIGILKGNAIFITRHLRELYGPSGAEYEVQGMQMMETAEKLGMITMDQDDLFDRNGELLEKYKFDAPFDKLKLKRRIGEFAFGSLWEVIEETPEGSVRRAVKVQSSKSKSHMKKVVDQIETWCRVIERGASNVPYILTTKELPNVVLILMEYTPSMPVDTAHEYLKKIMDKDAALKKMRETASDLLPVLAKFMKRLHSPKAETGSDSEEKHQIFLRDSDNPETYKEQKSRGVLTNNILVRFDSMGNLAGTWIIDFTWAQIRNAGKLKDDDVATDWGDLLFSFLVLYRNSNMLVAANKGKVDKKRLEDELMKCSHINDVTDAINKIQKKHGDGKTIEDIDDLVMAARERDVEPTARDMKGIVFGRDGTVIGFAPSSSKTTGKSGAFDKIVFASSFMDDKIVFTNTEERFGYGHQWTDASDIIPKEFHGNITDGFVCKKEKRQWRITITGNIYELFEEVCLDSAHPKAMTPILILRIDTRARNQPRKSQAYRNVWYMPGGGSDDHVATFSFSHEYNGVRFFYFEFRSLGGDDDETEYEYDDPRPHPDLGVAVGWKPVKVNGREVKDVREFVKKPPSGQITFVKPEPTPCHRRLCGSEMQMSESGSTELAPKIFAGSPNRWGNTIHIWMRHEVKIRIDKNSFLPTNNDHVLWKGILDVLREGLQYAMNQWNALKLGCKFVFTDVQAETTYLVTLRAKSDKHYAFAEFPEYFPKDGENHIFIYIQPGWVKRVKKFLYLKRRIKNTFRWREYAVLLHEFGHALGARHEDCRNLAKSWREPGVWFQRQAEPEEATWLGGFALTNSGKSIPRVDPYSVMNSRIGVRWIEISPNDYYGFRDLYKLEDEQKGVGDKGYEVIRRDPRRACLR